ncbi:MAG: two-component regulator propeller domain-containing protein [Niabella sp.]
MKSSIILVVLIACQSLSLAQHYYFRHYQVEDGLSNNTVICTMQDSKGFLWFGTKDGLNRFDGYTFKVFRNNPADSTTIGNNSIWRLYEDKNKQLWVGTERGLYRYNASIEGFSLLKGTPQSEIRGIVSDNNGDIWFIASFKLYRYSSSNKKLYDYSGRKSLNICTAIAKGSNGNIWIGTINGDLLRHDDQHDNFSFYNLFAHSEPTVSNWIEKIYDSGKGFLLIGTSNQGIKRFDLQSRNYIDLLTYNADNTEIYARDFIEYRPDEYWIATESGIYIYKPSSLGTFTHIEKNTINQYAISDNAVYAFAKDGNGGIWACTYFGGINYHPRPKLEFEKFIYDPSQNSLKGNAVREIKQDLNGNLWIGTEDAGLNKYNPHTGKFVNFSPKDGHSHIAHTNIHGLLVDSNRLWIGTFEHGLDIMNIETRKVTKHYSYGYGEYDLKSNFIYTFYKRKNGKILIGSSNGLYIYNPKQDNFIPLSFLPSGNFFSSIIEDSSGNIWAGTFKSGLFFYNERLKIFGNLKIIYNGRDKLSDYRISNLYLDSKQNLWACTEDGLFRIDIEGKKARVFTTKSGLPGNMVYCITEDKENNFWITTSKGLVKLTSDLKNITVFTKSDGLLSDQFNYSSVFKDSTGRIFLGSVKGLISFNPSALSNSKTISLLYITNFQINNHDVGITRNGPLKQSLLNTSEIVLTHLQSSISLDFAALNYASPDNIEYAYMLEGLDRSWNYIKTNRRVYFTNLSPGTYRFIVKSTDSNGNWANNERILSIKILPPWWLSKFAYSFYILLGILTVYAIIRFYHNRQQEKQKIRMVAFERAKEKEMYESKIDFFTKIAHEIRTPLTLIKAPMEKIMNNIGQMPRVEKYLRVMDKNTQRLLELTNQLLDFRKIESGEFSLHKEHIKVSELLQNTHSSFIPLAEHKAINFELHIPDKNIVGYIDEEATTKILSNLFDNAIKYSKSFVKATINRSFATKEVIITISNDGKEIPKDLQEKIFEPFFRTTDVEKITGTGIGLSLARTLAELQGGSLSLESINGINTFTFHLPLK